MKTFIILQKIVAFRVDWKNLYNPESYSLILIVKEEIYDKLAQDQRFCFAKIYRLTDFTEENIITHVQKIQQEEEQVELITNDELCVEIAARIRERLGLPGDRPEKVIPFLNKVVTKSLLKKHDVRVPAYLHFDPMQYKKSSKSYLQAIQRQLSFPIFAKPIDSAATQHATKIVNEMELKVWCEAHRDSSNYELDEFIAGTLYHCDSIIQEEQIIWAKAAENGHPCFDFMSGKVTGTITLPMENAVHKEILAFNKKILNALKPLPNCVTHLELFRRANGELIFLEVACRAPGGMIVQMYEKRYGLNIEQGHFAMQMGLPTNLTTKTGPHTAWAWFPSCQGCLMGFSSLPIKSPHRLAWKVQIGDKLKAAESLIDFIGSILLWNDDYEILQEDFAYLKSLAKPPVIMELSREAALC